MRPCDCAGRLRAGNVEVRRFKEKNWQPALLNDNLCPGDTVRVRERGRAALRLSNESVVRLDQKTTLVLPGPDEDNKTVLELLTGAIYVITRTPKPFRVSTPFLNADVEGTEFFIRADQDSARLVIYEGRVSASNEQGSVSSRATNQRPPRGMRRRVKRGRAPTDAVQWALYYPTIIDYRLTKRYR